MKILVTGATGFIGNYVVEELLRNNCEVIVTSANEEKAGSAGWFSKVNYIPFDLKGMDSSINYFTFFNEPDKLIHLAWEGLPNYKASFHLEENLPRHKSFLNNLIGNGLKDLTVTGTCFEYGMKEGCLDEEMETHPANAYAIAKDSLRKWLQQPGVGKAVQFRWLRLFYMYGRGQSPNSLFSQLDKALQSGDEFFNMSGGEQERDYLPVEKVAAYIVKTAMQDEVTGIINICSGKPVTVKQMVENYLKQRNVAIALNLGYYPYSDYEPMRFWGDNSRLKSILNQV